MSVEVSSVAKASREFALDDDMEMLASSFWGLMGLCRSCSTLGNKLAFHQEWVGERGTTATIVSLCSFAHGCDKPLTEAA